MPATAHDVLTSSVLPETQYHILALVFDGRYTWVYRSKVQGPEDKIYI